MTEGKARGLKSTYATLYREAWEGRIRAELAKIEAHYPDIPAEIRALAFEAARRTARATGASVWATYEAFLCLSCDDAFVPLLDTLTADPCLLVEMIEALRPFMVALAGECDVTEQAAEPQNRGARRRRAQGRGDRPAGLYDRRERR